MGMWIELFIFVLVLAFGFNELRQLKKLKQERERKEREERED